jgi:GNAT superfamily N-acetyltransferase
VAETFLIRPATADDAEILVEHRRSMFLEMGYRDAEALDRMCAAFRPWLLGRLEAREYLAWLAMVSGGTVTAGLGLWLMDWPPHMIGLGARRGNIVNVYTIPEARRLGLARRLMGTALDWCRANGIRAVILHSSDDGRPLYQELGFRPTNEMRLVLEQAGKTSE